MSRYRVGNAKDNEPHPEEIVARYGNGRRGTLDEKGLAQAAQDLNLDPEKLREKNIPIERQRRGAD